MIGGNTIAELQVRTTAKNEIGEAVKTWTTVHSIEGFLDLMTGDSNYQINKAKIQESSHIFICDWKQLNPEAMKAENCRIIINNEKYDVMLIDDPMGLHQHFEFYLKYTGGQ